MKTITKQKTITLLRLDKGQEVIFELSQFAKKENVQSAHFTGLGACSEVTLAYYKLETKKYLDKTSNEDLEIVSLTGNIAWLDKEPIVHMHGVFSDKKFQTVGGHVKKLVISATCEIHLTILPKKHTREFNEEIGLNLLRD